MRWFYKNIIKNGLRNILILLVKFYRRFISPLKQPSCIYTPTCSTYALEALERYGFFKGGYLSLKRILRCHPFSKGGFDPVPNKEEQ
jgi:putative membrane protein insertion efficiency factor